MASLKNLKIDENGLIVGYKYIFTEDGLVDWKAMVPKQFIYVNNDPKKKSKIEAKYGKSYEQLDPINDKIDDSDLIITLGGLKYLLRIRQYESVISTIKDSNESYASVNCSIKFAGNYETFGVSQTYSDNACAHNSNTYNFARNYLLEIASNRALARCIRSYLNINIVSREELGQSTDNDDITAPSPSDAQISLFESLMKKKNITFKQLKNKIVSEGLIVDGDKLNSVRDIPKDKLFDLIERLNKFDPNKV